ncbi:hypothetical protein HOA55_04505 [archaeon]|jgi:hypothetical protein|nr:hypothetical protein [archaeon]MBT3577988.1 hypothetical protein [archaeon]MBT6820591.1 hypothetical protein [archaeon]MBT6956526.1 hypothetical protein [archaeon]MBT7025842.1 hypothetical protein [archaeon]
MIDLSLETANDVLGSILIGSGIALGYGATVTGYPIECGIASLVSLGLGLPTLLKTNPNSQSRHEYRDSEE